MPEPRHLPNAPITEALFDFRFESKIKLTNEHFNTIRASIADRYPNADLKQEVDARIKFEAGKVQTDKLAFGVKGLFGRSADGSAIAQFRGDGFTFNRLRPYTKWDVLFPEAFRLWNIYRTVVSGVPVSRVALRYINHFDLPLEPGEGFSLFLAMSPDLPQALPQGVSQFLIRFTVLEQALAIATNVTQALQGDPGPRVKVLLDIDVYKILAPPVGNEDELKNIFSMLRELKNRVFFSLLTERCLQLFQ